MGWPAVAAVPAAFLAVFFVIPVTTILWEGLVADPSRLGELVSSGRNRSVIAFTVWQATASTLLTLVVALPAAALLARTRGWTRRLLRAAVTVPFVLPTVAVAGAFDATFVRLGLDHGAVDLRHTVWAILLAHLFFNHAVVARTVGVYWSGLDRRVEDQARVLGAAPWRVFTEITWPRLRPAVAAASVIVFLFSFTSFGIILVLGGPRRATIETEIYRHAVTRLDLGAAASLAALQLLAVVALVAVANRLERVRVGPTQRGARATVPRPGPLLVGTNLVAMGLVLGLPLGIVVERSLAVGGGYSLANYRTLADRVALLPAPATTALAHSLSFAVLATVCAVVVGTAASAVVVAGPRRLARPVDLALTVPLGVSAVTVGFGILVALDTPPLDWRSRWWIIPVAHALVGVPFVVRSVVPVVRGIDPRVREAAAVLGASPRRVRREVDVPIAARALAVGAAFAAAVSLGEFGATSFLPRRPDTITAPLALFRLLSTPGDALRGQAMALAVVLMLVTAAAVLVVESLGGAEGTSV
ncbi:MAG: iron ABC transporter permease [Actinomyces sp.]|nr:MAG: iron ABC transporter permease [Actinomyces sp.]